MQTGQLKTGTPTDEEIEAIGQILQYQMARVRRVASCQLCLMRASALLSADLPSCSRPAPSSSSSSSSSPLHSAARQLAAAVGNSARRSRGGGAARRRRPPLALPHDARLALALAAEPHCDRGARRGRTARDGRALRYAVRRPVRFDTRRCAGDADAAAAAPAADDRRSVQSRPRCVLSLLHAAKGLLKRSALQCY